MALKPLESLPETPLKIKRALLSVSDKTGITALAKSLHEQNVQLISTGGTAKAIRDAGIPVTDVSKITGFEECLDGRVKTLHPVIHGGILARTSHAPDREELERLNIKPIELVVVNLYPFAETVKKEGVTPAEATENIDIGGPTMIRAAAKNFAHVTVLTSPNQYKEFSEELEGSEGISFPSRRKFGREAFEHTAAYDTAISNFFSRIEDLEVPGQLSIAHQKSGDLRYGENPHQKAGVYGNQDQFIDCFHGKQLSYNNYLDVDAALKLMADFPETDTTIAIFKHTVPCGVGISDTLADAYKKAFSTDTVSPFGGIVCSNKTLDINTAREIDTIFTEIIMAPDFTEEARELLQQKKNRRLIQIKKWPDSTTEFAFRSIFGGALLQQENHLLIPDQKLTIPTKRKPTDSELKNLHFAWKVVKHIKSNGIVFANDLKTIGIGTGQTSRVDSSEIAILKAQKEGLSVQGSVVASDAFFPFADGVEAAAEAGATAIIQPGGSIRDEEVIKAADKHNLAMIFTGTRHFRH
ncbi:bifunctional phosphoribosylaminoimidazolecarboxamide formyltransferase/IMP cyclohydrolase PurH [Rhodohalobacter sp. SW132]|uniref:bifunctional phosphoribosylaminoimidazolecarboxamide formyltransferase/IMP cyclohydrolase n=1 Tax=Rhodohalobacter sp. SW132 TaxID=2293433 RepID=UPI000E23FEF9|nr:bifunctional phosphoribosylaminoimidazolecarboxamide formyltransferase/IMP cyclohydrolase [Rhodohalobacter sp. SW132]REL33108.1 bifunctional phosphoribosylaminoimidazolecarboxamide formyltransferase/IMP cyclohydrolase PurH [Rhodohalobacter sp. SW132]